MNMAFYDYRNFHVQCNLYMISIHFFLSIHLQNIYMYISKDIRDNSVIII